MPNLTQTIINIMMLDCKPNIHKELHCTFLQNSFHLSLRMMVQDGGFIRHIIYQQCISKMRTKIPKEKIRKVLMINNFITSGMIITFVVPFTGKLHNVFVNFTQILTNNPLSIDFNTHIFCYFLQVDFQFVKWN